MAAIVGSLSGTRTPFVHELAQPLEAGLDPRRRNGTLTEHQTRRHRRNPGAFGAKKGQVTSEAGADQVSHAAVVFFSNPALAQLSWCLRLPCVSLSLVFP
jgi:hypothetical protein